MTNTPRRDPIGIVAASFFIAIAAAALITPIVLGGWWWLLLLVAIPAGLLGAVGMTLDAVKRPRDDRGHAIR